MIVVKLSINFLYNREMKIIGTTGGNRKDLLDIDASKELKVKGRDALESLYSKSKEE